MTTIDGLGGEGMSKSMKQATLQQMGGKGNIKRAPGKMGGSNVGKGGPTGGAKRRGR